MEDDKNNKKNMLDDTDLSKNNQSDQLTIGSGKMFEFVKVWKWPIISVALVVLLALSIVTAGFGITAGATGLNDDTSGSGQLSSKEVASEVSSYINKMLQGQASVKVLSVENENGLYHMQFSIADRLYDSYVTKDGKLFFPTFINLTEDIQIPEQEYQEVPKTDKPVANVFVMSYCPYGLQFMKAYIPVLELLGGKADLNVNFVNYVMHGQKEMIENTRMYCIQKEYKDKFPAYLRCFVENDDPEKCMADAGIGKANIDTCMNSTDAEYELTKTFRESSTQFPPYPLQHELNVQYGVQGSPTFVLNGIVLPVSRSPEAIKQAVCDAFNNPPEECQQTLSTDVEAPGFGPIGSGSGTDTGAQC
mgnify:CR=1 FL=1